MKTSNAGTRSTRSLTIFSPKIWLSFSGGAILALLSIGCAPSGPALPALPDLAVWTVSVPASAVAADDQWELGATVVNTGTAVAAASSLEYWYSDDGILDGGDVLIGTHPVPALAAGATFADVWSTTYAVADSGGGAGTRRIFAVADGDAAISEPDEANNTSRASVAVLYDRVIIDTYKPGALINAANTFASLFGPAGDPTTETGTELWNENNPPYTVDAPPTSIAEADNGNPVHNGCARIDYADGLAPGTYYVRVRGQKSWTVGVYAVRILLAPDDDYSGGGWYFGVISDDASYETDDNPPSGGVPTNPVLIAVGGKLNRALTDGDVDWLVFTLP